MSYALFIGSLIKLAFSWWIQRNDPDAIKERKRRSYEKKLDKAFDDGIDGLDAIADALHSRM